MAFPTQSLALVAASSQFGQATDSASLSVTGNITIEAWIKFTDLPGAGNKYEIVSKFGASGQRSYTFGYDNGQATPGNSLALYASQDGTNATATSGHANWTPSTGTWYHVAAEATPASPMTMTFYIDGTAQTTTYDAQVNTTAIFDSTTDVLLGAITPAAPANFFNGKISQTRIWSSNRTSSELSNNWCTELGSTTNLKAEWTLDNTLNDNSGNSNTLTSHGSPSFSADVPGLCSATFVRDSREFLILGVG